MQGNKERKLVRLKPNDVWKPSEKGEILEGIYKRSEVSKFPNGKESIGYVIDTEKTGTPREDEIKVYGKALDKVMTLIKGETFVRIVYNGSKPLGDYRKLRLFDVLVDEEDAPKGCYEYLDGKDTPNEDNHVLSDQDDPEARNTIDLILKELGNNSKPEDVVAFAIDNQEDWELSDEDVTRIKVQAAKMGG